MIEANGVVVEVHRGGLFEVEVEIADGVHTIMAKTGGKMKKFSINLVVGDNVKVELSPYDLTKGRIKFRY